MAIKNLYKETCRVLESNKVSWNDIVWIGTEKGLIPEDDWYKLFDVNYDNSFGSSKVAMDLIVVGKNWWLERHEYDGSEWWEFKRKPVRPTVLFDNIHTVVDTNYSYADTLLALNRTKK